MTGDIPRLARPGVTSDSVDVELHALIADIEGSSRQPHGRSLHIHQLDGRRLEAMVYLEPEGARVEWTHGKGDCAVTGPGAAILALLRGEVTEGEPGGEGLVLYGDRMLIDVAPSIFNPRR